MSSKFLNKAKKYLAKITVVAVALAMATTLTFASSQKEEGLKAPEDTKQERTYEKMIAHGGGSVEGFDTSSSVDAVMLAIKNGFKLIELDMEFSSDDKIIMLHDWDRTVMTYLGRKYDKKLNLAQFNHQLICGKFEPLTFDKLTKILDDNPEVRIITDTKGDNIKLLTTIAEKYPKYVSRMIPQIYDYSEFEDVSELGYEDIIFTLYMQSTIDYNKLLRFVKENDIYAVTIGKDYWIKGLPQKLLKDGVVVYTHPVSTVEEARAEFAKGAYGIYSSTLIPSEIEGYEAEYYLMQPGGKSGQVKLTDYTINENSIRNIKTHGNMDYKAFKYKVDGKVLEEGLGSIESSPSDKHELTVEIWDLTTTPDTDADAKPKTKAKPDTEAKSKADNDAEAESTDGLLYTMTYTLTKNQGMVRILDKKYDYRLEPLKELPDFHEVMSEEAKTKPSEKIVEILSQSFIAKAGEYYYYNDGESGSYSVEDELLLPQKSTSGNVLVPLAETITALGAEKITMDSSRYVYLSMNNSKFVSQVYSYFVRRDTYNNRINEPISLYRSKAMAGGEFILTASGRDFVQGEDELIILPQNCKLTEKEEEQLIEAAGLLYKTKGGNNI